VTTQRRRIARAALALGVGAALAFGWVQLRSLGAWAIVRAPSFDGPTVDATPPPSVDRVVRVEVGPPAATIEAWVLEPPAARGTTLVLHGIRDDKRSMLGIGERLRRRGHRAVLVDLRGHGASSGRFLTYGVRESRDLVALLDHLASIDRLDGPVGIYGPSYGGAVALQAAARDPRITRVASLSTFSSLRAVVPPYAAHVVPVIGGALPGPVIDAVVDEAGSIAGFSADDADAAAAIARTDAQVLLVHGTADRNIPVRHARALASACGPGACTLVELDGADHAGALADDGAVRRAIAFLTAP